MTIPTNEEIFTLPPGRIIWGSVFKPRTTNKKGEQIIIKSGANKGQPGAQWSFGLALSKTSPAVNPTGAQNWWETPWGQRIMGVGQRGFLNGSWQRPDFAWKITDGDSAIPNTVGKAPNASEYNRGHWIIAFTTYTGAPPQFMKDQSGAFKQILDEAAYIKTGYYAEVNVGIKPNTGESAGLYLTPRMVALVGYGTEIIMGPDVNEAGFGQQAMPAGAMATPVGGMAQPGGMPGAAMGMGGMPQPVQMGQMMQPGAGMPMLPQQGAMMGQVPATGMPMQQGGMAPQPVAVAPHPAILGMGQMQQGGPGMQVMGGPGVGMPQMQPAQHTPQRVMTQKANGATYEQFLAMNVGWNDQTLVDQGMMVWQ